MHQVIHQATTHAVSSFVIGQAMHVPDGLTMDVLTRGLRWQRAGDVGPRDLRRVLAGVEIKEREPMDFEELGREAGTSSLTRVEEPIGRRTFRFDGELLSLPPDFEQHCGRAQEIRLTFGTALGGDSEVCLRAIEILNSAVERGAVVTAYLERHAASAHADLYALCPGHRTMAPTATIMLHGSHSACFGDSGQLREAAARLEMNDEVIANKLAVRCGRTTEECRQWMQTGKDLVFDAEAAVMAGLADGIEEVGP